MFEIKVAGGSKKTVCFKSKKYFFLIKYFLLLKLQKTKLS